MDDRELRVKRIELALRTAETAAKIQAQRRIAILAVALTTAASFALAGISGQVPIISFPAAATAAAVVFLEVRGLAVDAAELDQASTEALRAIDNLMLPGGEHGADATQSDA